MPMTEPAAEAFVLAQINSAFGPVPGGIEAGPVVAQRQNLAKCIASLVLYIQANADVKAGIPVATPAGPGATTSPGQIE